MANRTRRRIDIRANVTVRFHGGLALAHPKGINASEGILVGARDGTRLIGDMTYRVVQGGQQKRESLKEAEIVRINIKESPAVLVSVRKDAILPSAAVRDLVTQWRKLDEQELEFQTKLESLTMSPASAETETQIVMLKAAIALKRKEKVKLQEEMVSRWT